MSNKVKDIDVKNRTYFFFKDIINIKEIDPSNVKIDEKSYKNFLFNTLDMIPDKIPNT